MIFFVITLLLLILNIWFFLKRGWEDSFYPAHYSTLYYPEERPVIRKWKEHKPGKLEAEVGWNRTPVGWKISIDGKDAGQVEGENPIFDFPDGDHTFHDYRAEPLPEGIGNPLEFKMRYIPSSIPAASNHTAPDRYIIRTEHPIGKFKQYPVSHWVDDYEYMDGDSLGEIDRILRHETGIKAEDAVSEKLEKLITHFRKTIGKECRGTPMDDFRWMNPFQIYRAMIAGKSKGYCTQHAQMFVCFANRAGLSTRLIQGARTQGNRFVFTGHTWVEAYIPEQDRWAWVEPSHGIPYVLDKNGQVLNTVDLANLREHDAFDGVTARIYKDWEWEDLEGEEETMIEAPFSQCNGVVKRQFIPASIFKWRQPPNVEDIRSLYGQLLKNRAFLWGNLVRYWFKPPLAYALYPVEGKRTYWIRHLLFWGFWLSLVSWILA